MSICIKKIAFQQNTELEIINHMNYTDKPLCHPKSWSNHFLGFKHFGNMGARWRASQTNSCGWRYYNIWSLVRYFNGHHSNRRASPFGFTGADTTNDFFANTQLNHFTTHGCEHPRIQETVLNCCQPSLWATCLIFNVFWDIFPRPKKNGICSCSEHDCGTSWNLSRVASWRVVCQIPWKLSGVRILEYSNTR